MASRRRGHLHVKDVLQVLDCDESDDGSDVDSDTDEVMVSASDVDTPDTDSDESFSSSDDEPLANIASTSARKNAATKTAKKKKSQEYQWEKKPFTAPDSKFTGPAVDLPPSIELDTPLGYFQRFVTDEMLRLLSVPGENHNK